MLVSGTPMRMPGCTSGDSGKHAPFGVPKLCVPLCIAVVLSFPCGRLLSCAQRSRGPTPECQEGGVPGVNFAQQITPCTPQRERRTN
jgi:hypothetical protein